MSVEQEIDATLKLMRNARLRAARLIDKAFREVDQEEASLEARLRVIGILTKTLKDLGTNIGQLRSIQGTKTTNEDENTIAKLLE